MAENLVKSDFLVRSPNATNKSSMRNVSSSSESCTITSDSLGGGSVTTPTRTTPTLGRKLFNYQGGELLINTAANELAADSSLFAEDGSAFSQYDSKSITKIDSGSAREFLSNKFSLREIASTPTSPIQLQQKQQQQPDVFFRSHANNSSNGNAHEDNATPKVIDIPRPSTSSLHLSKSLKLVENHVKFSKSEKTDLVAPAPSKAQIYDNLQLKNLKKQELMEHKYAANTGDYASETLDFPPKAPARTKIKRFIPGKELAKNLNLIENFAETRTSKLTTTTSVPDSGKNIYPKNIYCELPCYTNRTKPIADIYAENQPENQTTSNFKKLLKSDKLLSNKNGESESTLKSQMVAKNLSKLNEYKASAASNNHRLDNGNYRNGLYVDFELYHDLKIKPTQQQQQNQQTLTQTPTQSIVQSSLSSTEQQEFKNNNNVKNQKGELNPMNRTYTKSTRKPTPSSMFEHYELEKYRNAVEMVNPFPQYYSNKTAEDTIYRTNSNLNLMINPNKTNEAISNKLALEKSASTQTNYDFNMNNYIIQQHHLNLNYHQSNLNRKLNEMNRKSTILNNFHNANLQRQQSQQKQQSNYDTFAKYNDLNVSVNSNGMNTSSLINKRNSNIITSSRIPTSTSNNSNNHRSTQIYNV